MELPIGGWPVIIALVGLAVYWSGLHNPLVGDDVGFLGTNPALRIPQNLWRLWGPDYYAISAGGASYRPLIVMMWAIDILLFKDNSFGIHLSSLLVHLANSCLMYKLGKELSLREDAAAFGGLLFAVHPIHVEAINCVAFNGDPLAALFTFLAFLAYIQMRCRLEGGFWLAMKLTACIALALLSKESALVLPPLLLLYEILHLGQPPNVKALRRSWFAISMTTAGYMWLRFVALRSPRESHKEYIGGSLRNNLMTDLQLPVRYLKLLVWPHPLSTLHDVPFITRWTQWEFWFYGGTIFALGWLLYRLFLRSRRNCFFAAWIAVGFLPLLNLLPFLSLKVFFCERFLYLPSAGFCFLAASLWERLRGRRPRAAAGVAMTLLLLLSYTTYARTLDWKSDDVLNERAWTSGAAPFLANYLKGSDDLLQGHSIKAIGELEAALPWAPDETQANLVRRDLGVALAMSGRNREAITALSQVLAKNDSDALVQADLGTAYYLSGNGRLAAHYLEKAVLVLPNHAGILFDLAATYKMLGDNARAEEELNKSKKINPRITGVQFSIVGEK